MTEEEWLASMGPETLLNELRPRLGERKLRLFACACCRRVWPLLTRPAVREAVRTAELFADGLATKDDLRAGWAAVRKTLAVTPVNTPWEHALMAALNAASEGGLGSAVRGSLPDAVRAAEAAARALDQEWRERHASLSSVEIEERRRRGNPEERAYQCRLLADLLPDHPVAADPAWSAWQHGQLVSLARAIYDEGRFEDLPVLADALEEAGCAEPAILEHCRGPGPHARGCWVVDLLLARDG
jgi:hypothetical protein